MITIGHIITFVFTTKYSDDSQGWRMITLLQSIVRKKGLVNHNAAGYMEMLIVIVLIVMC